MHTTGRYGQVGRPGRAWIWQGVLALLWSAVCWPEMATGSACGEAQELLLLGIRLGQSCTGACLEQKVALYAQAVERCSQYPEAHNNLADAYEKLGKFAEAEAHYRRALMLQPRFAVPYFGLGDLYLRQGKGAAAIGMYEQGLRWEPEDGLSQQRLAGARGLVQAGSVAGEEVKALLASTAQVPPSPQQRQRLLVRVWFATNSALLSAEAIRQVEAIGNTLMQAEPGAVFIVEGHADSRGSKPYNRQLSRRRAEAVHRYLVEERGIASERLRIQALGDKEPVAVGEHTGAWTMNRRVEVVQVQGKENSR